MRAAGLVQSASLKMMTWNEQPNNGEYDKEENKNNKNLFTSICVWGCAKSNAGKSHLNCRYVHVRYKQCLNLNICGKTALSLPLVQIIACSLQCPRKKKPNFCILPEWKWANSNGPNAQPFYGIVKQEMLTQIWTQGAQHETFIAQEVIKHQIDPICWRTKKKCGSLQAGAWAAFIASLLLTVYLGAENIFVGSSSGSCDDGWRSSWFSLWEGTEKPKERIWNTTMGGILEHGWNKNNCFCKANAAMLSSFFLFYRMQTGNFPNTTVWRKKKLPSHLTINQTVPPNCLCMFTMSFAVDTIQDKQLSPWGSFNPFPSPQQRKTAASKYPRGCTALWELISSPSASLAHYTVHGADVTKHAWERSDTNVKYSNPTVVLKNVNPSFTWRIASISGCCPQVTERRDKKCELQSDPAGVHCPPTPTSIAPLS